MTKAPPGQARSPSAGLRGPLADAQFRRFWLGFVFSNIGDAMSRVALTWYVWEQTRSAQALGLLTFAYAAPVLIGGLVAGGLLDRYGPRKVMVLDNVLRGCAVLTIPLASSLGILHMWQIYAVATLYGSLMMISLAGSPALIPELVKGDSLNAANALETLGFTVAGAVGAPIAGILIAMVGAPNVMLFDAASYVLYAVLLASLAPHRETAARTPTSAQHVNPLDSVSLVVGSPVLLSTTLMFLTANVGLGMMFVWLPLHAEGLGGGSSLYGILMAGMAVGEVLSSLLAGGLDLKIGLGRLISGSQLAAGLSFALVLFGRNPLTSFGGLVLFGFFSAPLTIWGQTLRMRIIPPTLRGRTFALLRTVMQGGGPIGGLIAGSLVPSLGVVGTILGSALLIGGPGAFGWGVRELREVE